MHNGIVAEVSSDHPFYRRHPIASERPGFTEITRQLSLPDPKLLKWSREDKLVHPEATELEADLLCAEDLYKDLQNRYAKE